MNKTEIKKNLLKSEECPRTFRENMAALDRLVTLAAGDYTNTQIAIRLEDQFGIGRMTTSRAMHVIRGKRERPGRPVEYA